MNEYFAYVYNNNIYVVEYNQGNYVLCKGHTYTNITYSTTISAKNKHDAENKAKQTL